MHFFIAIPLKIFILIINIILLLIIQNLIKSMRNAHK